MGIKFICSIYCFMKHKNFTSPTTKPTLISLRNASYSQSAKCSIKIYVIIFNICLIYDSSSPFPYSHFTYLHTHTHTILQQNDNDVGERGYDVSSKKAYFVYTYHILLFLLFHLGIIYCFCFCMEGLINIVIVNANVMFMT